LAHKVLNKRSNAGGFGIQRRPLDYANYGWSRLWLERDKAVVRPWRVVAPNHIVRHGYDQFPTPPAFVEFVILHVLVAVAEIRNPFGVSITKAVDRLVNIADDGQMFSRRHDIDKFLLGPIQILVFIDHDVVVLL
jgi:hypothetical protein